MIGRLLVGLFICRQPDFSLCRENWICAVKMVVWLVLVSIIISKIHGKFFFRQLQDCYVINIDYSETGKSIRPRLLLLHPPIYTCRLVSEPRFNPSSHHLLFLPGFHPPFLKVCSIIPKSGSNNNLFGWGSRCGYHPCRVQGSSGWGPRWQSDVSSISAFGPD